MKATQSGKPFYTQFESCHRGLLPRNSLNPIAGRGINPDDTLFKNTAWSGWKNSRLEINFEFELIAVFVCLEYVLPHTCQASIPCIKCERTFD